MQAQVPRELIFLAAAPKTKEMTEEDRLTFLRLIAFQVHYTSLAYTRSF